MPVNKLICIKKGRTLMHMQINYTEQDIKKLVLDDLSDRFDINLSEHDLTFEVKSSQNYKAEWERGSFRLTVSKLV